MKITYIGVPIYYAPVEDSTAFLFDSTFHEPGNEVIMERKTAKALMVGFDVHEDGSKNIYKIIKYSDYTGLEQEWGDSTSVTILDTAVQDIVDLYSAKRLDPDSTVSETPSSYQRSNTLARSFTKTV